MESNSEHVLMDMRIDKFDPRGDVCAACSDPEAGIWVPVSFCPEAKEDSDRYYEDVWTDEWPSSVPTEM
jgi:hypothetical protein